MSIALEIAEFSIDLSKCFTQKICQLVYIALLHLVSIDYQKTKKIWLKFSKIISAFWINKVT
jgi:hypothetical protein